MAYWTVRRADRLEKGPKMQRYSLPQQRVHEYSGLGVREDAERLRTPLAGFLSIPGPRGYGAGGSKWPSSKARRSEAPERTART